MKRDRIIEELEWMQRRIKEMQTKVESDLQYWQNHYNDCDDPYEEKIELAHQSLNNSIRCVERL